MYSEWHRLQDEVIASAPPYPENRFCGRGIVICAGGARFFTNAWVLVRLLRDVLRSQLPIEVWYLGPPELDWRMAELLCKLGVTLRDAWQHGQPGRRPSKGWSLKPFAIVHASFREVLLLDADNVPVEDPERLFETPEYRATGAIFWPDLDPLRRDSAIWEICRVPYREEPSFETGQLLVDKQRSWKAMMLTLHMNEQSEFYYQHLTGDKDTFHLAWKMLDQEYSMIPHPVECVAPVAAPGFIYSGAVLLQRDFAGRVVFQHRNWPKWIMRATNLHHPGLRHEQRCLNFLGELAAVWDGRICTQVLVPPAANDGTNGSAWFRYERLGADARLLEFLPDGTIGSGAAHFENRWSLVMSGGEKMLRIDGKRVPTCRLRQDSPGIWKGQWLHHEGMEVELTRLTPPPVSRVSIYGPYRGLTGHDHHVRKFAREMDRRQVEVSLIDLPTWSPSRLPEHLREQWFESRNTKVLDGTLLQFCMPHQVVRQPDAKVINFTMFEATRVPKAWIKPHREDLVILPTESSRRAWTASGMLEDRIRLCPLGIDPEIFGTVLRPRDIPIPRYRTRFLNVSAYGPRKNLAGLLRVWKKATSRQDDAVLLLKVNCYEPDLCEAFARELQRLEGAAPVHLIDQVLSEREMPGLYAAATHYISVSHGEGWDLPMMEAAASGLELIAPAHSAYLSYLDDASATLLPCREVPVKWTGDSATGELFRGTNWWEPDDDAAVAAIRGAIDGCDQAKPSPRHRILTEFTWQKATQTLLQILKEAQDERPRRWFSLWPWRKKSLS